MIESIDKYLSTLPKSNLMRTDEVRDMLLDLRNTAGVAYECAGCSKPVMLGEFVTVRHYDC